MQSLSKREDIDKTLSLFEQRTQNISIPTEKTPWYILSPDFKTGYRHWVQLSNGNRIPVPCKGGAEGKGFAVDTCPFCKKSLEFYQKGKHYLQQGKTKQADKMKQAGNSIRATFSALFHAVKGVKVLEMVTTKTGKKKKLVPYFENFESDDDENKIEVGILSFSQAQFENFTGLITDDAYPFVQSGDDLCNRAIWTQKKKANKKKMYPEVVFSADKKTMEKPDVEIPEDQQDLESQFEISDEEFENIWKDFAGDVGEEMVKREKKRKKVVDDEDDEDEEIDDDDEDIDDEDDDDEDYEDEDDDDDDDDEEVELPDDAYLDDDEDDFEDDDPDDLPPKKSKSSAKKKSGSAKL